MAREKGKTRTGAAGAKAGAESKPTFESVWAAIGRLAETQERAAAAQEKAAKAAEEAQEKAAKAAAEAQEKAAEAQEKAAEAQEKAAEAQEKAAEERRKTEEVMREERLKTEAQWRETDERIRDLTESLQRVDGNFNNKWGEFMENLVLGDFMDLLRGRGVDVAEAGSRVKVFDEKNGRGGSPRAEYDLVALDGGTAVVAEVKTTLRDEDVREFLRKLKRFREHCLLRTFEVVGASGEFLERLARFQGSRDKRVLGAVAFMAVADRGSSVPRGAPPESGEADKLARDAGLFAIRSPGGAPGLAVVENPPDFEPGEF